MVVLLPNKTVKILATCVYKDTFRNMITAAFSGDANTIDNWIKEKARRPQSAAANSAQAVEFYPSGQQAFDDI